MSTYKQNNESKREEFRKYLERTGVVDKLTKALVSLYEEADKPQDAIDYVKSKLSVTTDSTESVESLQAQIETYKKTISNLETELATLKKSGQTPTTDN